MTARIQHIADDLFLIPLDLPLPGFTNFISVWLYRGEFTCLIDVGPSSTAPDLLQALQKLNIDQLDFIFLTHIHLDHAGAIGEIAETFIQTPIICHPAGLSHLIEPSRLWKGAQKVLGSVASAYGPIAPVAASRLLEANRFGNEWITPILTPGHAAHHVSFQTDKYLFAGEACGTYISLPEKRFYMRPGTPPRFFLDVAIESVDELIRSQPKTICYSHFGIHEDAPVMLEAHREQLLLWEAIIREEIRSGAANERTAACMQQLLKKDPLMAAFNQLPPEIQEREKYFILNSIGGYLGYLGLKD